VTVRIEAAGKDDRQFTTATETSFVVVAPAGADTRVECTAKDDGDIAYQWQRKQKGSYKLDLDVDVSTTKRAAAKTSRKDDSNRARSVRSADR
jgi:hypothetical protein